MWSADWVADDAMERYWHTSPPSRSIYEGGEVRYAKTKRLKWACARRIPLSHFE